MYSIGVDEKNICIDCVGNMAVACFSVVIRSGIVIKSCMSGLCSSFGFCVNKLVGCIMVICPMGNA